MLKNILICLCLTALPMACSSKTQRTNNSLITNKTAALQPRPQQPTVLDSCIYTKADSSRIVSLLKADIPAGKSDVLFYARQFLGTPYVAYTLEGEKEEPVVINTKGLDCTTFVETVCALVMTKRRSSDKFADYVKNIERIRYRSGQRAGYHSRLHYFTWWMNDGLRKGIFEEVADGKHFTGRKRIDNHYMSSNPHKYEMLKRHPEWTDSIASLERAENGQVAAYLPERMAGLGRKELSSIKDGDILAVVTRKGGLDYSHLGFAVWGKDGKLHLLNASSLYKKVVEDKKTLLSYLMSQKSAIGVKVLRLRQ